MANTQTPSTDQNQKNQQNVQPGQNQKSGQTPTQNDPNKPSRQGNL